MSRAGFLCSCPLHCWLSSFTSLELANQGLAAAVTCSSPPDSTLPNRSLYPSASP